LPAVIVDHHSKRAVEKRSVVKIDARAARKARIDVAREASHQARNDNPFTNPETAQEWNVNARGTPSRHSSTKMYSRHFTGVT